MKKLLNLVKYTLLVALSVALMAYALKGIDFTLVWQQLKEVNYFWIAVSLMLALAGCLSRAYRWKMQLEPLGYQVPLPKTYNALMVGYLANLVLPRAGEVIRCSMLRKTSGVAVKAGIGTVITERLLDMVMLLLLTGAAFLIEFERIHAFFWNLFSDKIASYGATWGMIYLLGGSLIFLVLLVAALGYFFRDKLTHHVLYIKIKTFIKGVAEGIFSVANLSNKTAFVGHTLFIWVTYFLTSYVGFLALPGTAHLGLGAALSVLVVGSLGMSAPVQGGIGVFHIMVRSTLLLYGLSKETGMAFALVNHTSQTLLVVLLGGISFIVSVLNQKPAAENPLPNYETNPVVYDNLPQQNIPE